MKAFANNSGFSLIELIVVAVIINILAGVAIVAYVGVQEKARRSRVIRTASTSTADLHSWLQSSLSAKRSLREIDTNFDGMVNSSDFTNSELFNKGVAETYVKGKTDILRDFSPWFNRPMWNEWKSGDPQLNGVVNLAQITTNQLRMVATEKNGIVVFERVIFSN
ncbi:MAG TPA: prepilin-type N-terminal cleavage/methylation domain-containing protein [Nitrospirae bacterium]|nr:prepilin-type N-terminal cleavage/methylation domain-containing protein [Nitrospirota bacterium]